MNILIVNDDGINARGIKILTEKIKKYGNIYVVAPDRGRSAASHSVILNKPLSFEMVEDGIVKRYQTSGMPADCVRLATIILDVKFDLVISGVNDGLNLGTDIIYSGTCAGAREAVIEGIPGVAVSTDFGCFDIVENELENVLDIVFKNKLFSNKYLLNINFPINSYEKSKGIKFAKQGDKIFTSIFSKMPDGLYSVTNEEEIHDRRIDTDVYLADQGYITFVPVQIDQTDYQTLKYLNEKLGL